MKQELKQEFKEKILLSEFDLGNQDFSNEWLNGFFINPVAENLVILNSEGQMSLNKLYINFSEIELPSSLKSKDFFITLNKEIKKKILEDWSGFGGKFTPLYNMYRISSDDEKVKKYLFTYLSPKKSTRVFDFNLISNRDYLISNVLELLLKAHLLEKSSDNHPIKFDVVSGKLFLNPEIKEDEDDDATSVDGKKSKGVKKTFVSVFCPRLFFKDFKLSFKLKGEAYMLDSNNTNLDVYDDWCHINNFKYEKRADARKHSRNFLDFKNYEHLRKTKFITQLDLYKNILEMFEKQGISHEKRFFTPEYLFTDFNKLKVSVGKINVFFAQNELDEFNALLSLRKNKQSFQDFMDYLKNELGLQANLITATTIQDVLKLKDECNLFCMFGRDYEDDFVRFVNSKGEVKNWNDPLIPFVEKKLYELNQEDFMKILNSFDLYSQVKLYNLYANNKGLDPIVSQGLVTSNLGNLFVNGKKGLSFPGTFTSVVSKVITELDIKYRLYVHKKVSLPKVFPGVNDISEFKNVRVINNYPKKSFKAYSSVLFEAIDDGFSVTEKKIYIGDEIKSLNLDFNIDDMFLNGDSLIIVDDIFVLKVSDNENMPFMILREDMLNKKEQDPLLIIEEKISSGSTRGKEVSRSAKMDVNFSYPYNTYTAKSIMKEKKKIVGYCNAMLDFSEGLRVFMRLNDAGLNETVAKNNRIETLNLFKTDGFDFEKVDWKEHEQLLYFYLSTITYDYLAINGVAKKSILNKMADVVLLN